MLRGFFSNLTDRPSCYQCRFKKRYRISDLTMWDCFDVYRFDKSFDDNRGVTRVLVQSEWGQILLDASLDKIRVQQIDAGAAVKGVRELIKPVQRNSKRDAFFSDMDSYTGTALVERWFSDTPRVLTERTIRALLENVGIYSSAKRIVRTMLGK